MTDNLLKSLSEPVEEENTLSSALSVEKKEPKEKEINYEELGDEYDRKFIIISTYGELLDIAMHLCYVEKEKVVLCITDGDYSKIGEGLIEKTDTWHKYLGDGWTWVVDGCEHADLQDWLRNQGEYVVGTNQKMADLEDDRQMGQKWFKEIGFNQPFSKNFTDIDELISFVEENKDKRWVLKQNGSAPKSLNHVGKFEGSEDMLFHLEELKKEWNEAHFGKFDVDIMEFVEGVEVAASAFFNGHDWLRDASGKVVGFLNFEEKKENDGNLGDTTGETGTTFFGTDETNSIFKEIIMSPKIAEKLKATKYQGVFDINGSLTDKGFVAFEATSRFGIPASSYEFMEGMKTSTADLLCYMAYGEDTPIEIVKGWGMVIVVTARPYPVEVDMEDGATSIGERLWLLEDGKPTEEMTPDQMKHIHLENFYCDDEGYYKVATKNGYLLTVTGVGKTVKKTRENLIKYIKENLYISGNKYRQDIGVRIEDHV